MNIEELKNENLDLELKVTIGKDVIAKGLEKELATASKEINMPGFRKGKVPMSMVKNKYGAAARQDVVKNSIMDSLKEIEESRKLKLATSPEVENIVSEEGKDVSFTAKYILMPEIKMPDWSKVKIEKPAIEFSDKEIDEFIADIAKQSTSFKEVKAGTKAKMDDQVTIDAIGYVDDKAFAGGKLEGHKLVLGSKSFIDNFEEQLVGAKAGDEIKVKVKFPDEYHAKELAGKDAVFDCKVIAVSKAETPTMDDAFVKENFKVESLEEFKGLVKKDAEGKYNNQITILVKKRLFDELEKLVDFPLSNTLLEKEIKLLESQLKAGGNDSELEGKSDKEKQKYIEDLCKRRLRIGFLLAEYSNSNNIKITNQDLQAEVSKRVSMMEPRMQEFYIKYIQENKSAIEEIKGSVVEDKTVEHILKNQLKSTEKKYSKKKMDELLESEI